MASFELLVVPQNYDVRILYDFLPDLFYRSRYRTLVFVPKSRKMSQGGDLS